MDQWPVIDRLMIEDWVRTKGLRLPISDPIEAVEVASYAELATGIPFEPDGMVGMSTLEALHGELIDQVIRSTVCSDESNTR